MLRPHSLPTFPLDYFLAFLDSRKDWLEGVCITGGEPLISDDIDILLKIIKERDLLVKIDTNGAFPERLASLITGKLLDHVAMDVKTSLEKYSEATGCPVNIDAIKKSIALIKDSELDYTFRTTAVPGLVGREDIEKISTELEGSKMLRIQQFVPHNTLESEYEKIKPYSTEELWGWVKIAEPYFSEVRLEGV